MLIVFVCVYRIPKHRHNPVKYNVASHVLFFSRSITLVYTDIVLLCGLSQTKEHLHTESRQLPREWQVTQYLSHNRSLKALALPHIHHLFLHVLDAFFLDDRYCIVLEHGHGLPLPLGLP